MDIQKMVDERIKELREVESLVPALSFYNTDAEVYEEIPGGDHRFGKMQTVIESSPPSRGEDFVGIDEHRRDDLQDLIDGSLNDVAEKILSITEQVAGDYARMEKDILDSRLALLQSAEEVLDIAISLKKKARGLLSSLQPVRDGYDRYDDDFRFVRDSDSFTSRNIFQERRASMHDEGVASLFRKT